MKFAELDEETKKLAIEEYCDINVEHCWWEYIFDYAHDAFRCLGFTLDGKAPFLFSGFWSQGDGAAFNGSLLLPLREDPVSAIAAYAPVDDVLLSVAKTLQVLSVKIRLQTEFEFHVEVIKANNSFTQIVSVNILIEGEDYLDSYEAPEDYISEEMKSVVHTLATWVYRQLEAEYEYLSTDSAVAEALIANEYEFDELGCIL